MPRDEHGSAGARGEQAANTDAHCTRFGCEEPVASVEKLDGAVQVTCSAGHVEETVAGSVGADAKSASTPVDEPSTPDGVTRGAVDGSLDRRDGYDRPRPDVDEVGSGTHNQTKNRNVPVVDPSEY